MSLLDLTVSQSRSHMPRASLLNVLIRAVQLHRQRTALRKLDEAALKDIGVSRAQAEREARRSIWDQSL